MSAFKNLSGVSDLAAEMLIRVELARAKIPAFRVSLSPDCREQIRIDLVGMVEFGDDKADIVFVRQPDFYWARTARLAEHADQLPGFGKSSDACMFKLCSSEEVAEFLSLVNTTTHCATRSDGVHGDRMANCPVLGHFGYHTFSCTYEAPPSRASALAQMNVAALQGVRLSLTDKFDLANLHLEMLRVADEGFGYEQRMLKQRCRDEVCKWFRHRIDHCSLLLTTTPESKPSREAMLAELEFWMTLRTPLLEKMQIVSDYKTERKKLEVVRVQLLQRYAISYHESLQENSSWGEFSLRCSDMLSDDRQSKAACYSFRMSEVCERLGLRNAAVDHLKDYTDHLHKIKDERLRAKVTATIRTPFGII